MGESLIVEDKGKKDGESVSNGLVCGRNMGPTPHLTGANVNAEMAGGTNA